MSVAKYTLEAMWSIQNLSACKKFLHVWGWKSGSGVQYSTYCNFRV